MFWIGFGTGIILGGFVGVMCIALVTISHRSEQDDKEQVAYFAKQKDRNEF